MNLDFDIKDLTEEQAVELFRTAYKFAKEHDVWTVSIEKSKRWDSQTQKHTEEDRYQVFTDKNHACSACRTQEEAFQNAGERIKRGEG